MFKVMNWDTGKIESEHENLAAAKRACRKLGHLPEHNGKWFLPVAYVSDGRFCVYNPRFKVQ